MDFLVNKSSVKIDGVSGDIFWVKNWMKEQSMIQQMRKIFPDIIFHTTDIKYVYMRVLPDKTRKIDQTHTRGNFPVTIIAKYGDCSE